MKISLLLIAALLIGASCANSQVVLIANNSVPDGSLTESQLIDICLLSTRTWSDGQSIELFFPRDNGGEEKEFYAMLHRTPLEMRKVWLRAQLSGQARPPVMMASQEELVRKIETTPGAFGFVNKEKVRGNVKIIHLSE
jgi:ABC-type phosphate transport system substrate-binding protein